VKHKLKSRIEVRKQKGRSKKDEEDGRRMLGVPLFVSLVVSSLLSQLKVCWRDGCFVNGKSGWLPQCLYVETHRSLSLSVFKYTSMDKRTTVFELLYVPAWWASHCLWVWFYQPQ
jgi:hypothetical protein